jgi:beta-glucosidase
MDRRKFVEISSLILPGILAGGNLNSKNLISLFDDPTAISSPGQLGQDFRWGVAASAFQSEGAFLEDGKGPSIWDTFTAVKRKVLDGSNARESADFYHRYREDIRLAKHMNFNSFRLSLSWPRIFPEGAGHVNQKGLDFYHNVIDECLDKNMEPWITLYHWDLPHTLEDRGGWTNREIVGWFTDYVDTCTRVFGDKVKNWIVMNEPMSFTGLGYFLGYHAPGRKGLRNFLPAAHHAALCQAEGGRIVRANVQDAYIGTALSCAHIKPINSKEINVKAASRMDALFNRFYIEPLLGMGYPTDTLGILNRIEKYFKPGDNENLKFDFDFIGLQYYYRLVSKFSLIPPAIFANEVPASERNVRTNSMGFEIYPKGLYKVLKKFNEYEGIRDIIITETGVCHDDRIEEGRISDQHRIEYFRELLAYTLKAQQKGIPVKGFFVWSLTDNFEWREGYKPRFGLVYIDYTNLRRTIKDSGLWFRDFLHSNTSCNLH